MQHDDNLTSFWRTVAFDYDDSDYADDDDDYDDNGDAKQFFWRGIVLR